MGVDDLDLAPPKAPEIEELFDFLEFRSLREFAAEVLDVDLGGADNGAGVLEATVESVSTAEAAADALRRLAATADPVALAPGWGDPLDTRQPHRRRLLGLALVADLDAGQAVWLPADLLESAGHDALTAFFGVDNGFMAHDVKPLVLWLLSQGIDAGGLTLDAQIAGLSLGSGQWAL